MNRLGLFRLAIAAIALLLGACSSMEPRDFARTTPAFSPDQYFEGRTESRGFFETRGGEPRATFSTHATGHRDGDAVALHQEFTYSDGRKQERRWRIRRLDARRYEATANDVVGVARGEVFGSTFHWRYKVALSPGNPFSNVALEQWMTLQPDRRTVSNRAIIRKWGIRVGMVTETFRREKPL